MKWIQNIWVKVKKLLKQGLSPKQLSLSIVISILISVFPAYGIATIILTFVAVPLKLNLPVMVFVSYIAEPIKILIFLPLIHLGADVMDIEHTLLTLDMIQTSFDEDFWRTIKELSLELICGAIGWTIVVIPSGIILHLIFENIISLLYKFKQIKKNEIS